MNKNVLVRTPRDLAAALDLNPKEISVLALQAYAKERSNSILKFSQYGIKVNKWPLTYPFTPADFIACLETPESKK